MKNKTLILVLAMVVMSGSTSFGQTKGDVWETDVVVSQMDKNLIMKKDGAGYSECKSCNKAIKHDVRLADNDTNVATKSSYSGSPQGSRGDK